MMTEMKYIYGPVPSRRLGLSLGISPIPKKTCNYSCIYCQLGRTNSMVNKRKMFFPVKSIMNEFDQVLSDHIKFDVVTIVGEGEPTLYLGLGELIMQIHKKTTVPVVVITNGALLYDPQVQLELSEADIVMPSMDGYDNESFKKINRPHKDLSFTPINSGLEDFSRKYQGELWLEIMLLKGINDDNESLAKYGAMLKNIRYDKLYLNTCVRPPAESFVIAVDHEKMNYAAEFLGGIPIDLLASYGFHSEIKDDYLAIISIIKRHPMNQFEIEGFLKARNCPNVDKILNQMKNDAKVNVISYKGYDTYRLS